MIYSRARVPQRFSLHLLQEGEHYLEDHRATRHAEGSERGRLKLCSHSLCFVPDELSWPVVRYPFKDMSGLSSCESKSIQFESTTWVEMQVYGQDVPYKVIRSPEPQSVKLEFEFANVKDLLALTEKLHAIEQIEEHFKKESELLSMISAREQQIRFDESWLDDIREITELEARVLVLSPQLNSPARLHLTDSALYLQMFYTTSARPVERHALERLEQVAPSSYLLQDIAVRVQFEDGFEAVLVCSSSEEAEQLISKLTSGGPRKSLWGVGASTEAMQNRWLNREVSNFAYLNFLNTTSSRCVMVLAQYPVFPWVLSDYSSAELDLTNPASFRDLSKPVGALNPDRLATFQSRFEQMPDCEETPRYMYSTHYSAPAAVLFYLIRKMPAQYLQLQNGKFDLPDRLFNSIQECWKSVNTSPHDVKELIPEFYDLEEAGAFLLNSHELQLGTTQSGEACGAVGLPPWANGSASEFVRKNREALECDYVSERLHLWIDLVFGYKQRGDKAVRANNVFHYLSYQGAVDWPSLHGAERVAIEAQVREFGQTPAQLFTSPHPGRRGADGSEPAGLQSEPSTPPVDLSLIHISEPTRPY
eukprot:TRINITY_DN20663_c0_g1_i1.p1 TRINITY_DN20663_c0_g1~~TRINITY_DN20663_c0_g1_i1.p1  ORF type:complete len:591 (-),score=144.24 TRINITY_DN20663_c0_g1_i1:33-1805(-)